MREVWAHAVEGGLLAQRYDGQNAELFDREGRALMALRVGGGGAEAAVAAGIIGGGIGGGLAFGFWGRGGKGVVVDC